MLHTRAAKRITQLAVAMLAVSLAGSAGSAQGDSTMKKSATKQAEMAKDSAGKAAAMKKDAMKGDGMAKEAAMKSDGLMRDGMKSDGMKSDGMNKDAMKEDAMKMDAMKGDAMDKVVPPALNLDARGVALHGYDPVAYFTAHKPETGNEKFSVTRAGATYHFASAANRDLFAANPASYTPQYGGYCAMGVALNKKLDVDPKAWRVVDGKLYLNVSKKVQSEWAKDVPGNIRKAETNWPGIRQIPASEL